MRGVPNGKMIKRMQMSAWLIGGRYVDDHDNSFH